MSDSALEPVVLRIRRRWTLTLRVPSSATGGGLCIVEHELEPGYVALPLHRQEQRAIALQVLQGELSVQGGERVTRLAPGDVAAVPPGEWYTFWNSGSAAVRFQEVAAPGGLDQYYARVAPLIPDQGAPDVEAILPLGEPFGIEFQLESLLDLTARHGVRLA